MSIAPFSPHPAPARPDAQGGWWRTRLAILSVSVGIAATLLAYAISPGLRHAVSHAEHSVGHAVSRVFDRDAKAHALTQKPNTTKAAPAHTGAAKHPATGTSTTSTR